MIATTTTISDAEIETLLYAMAERVEEDSDLNGAEFYHHNLSDGTPCGIRLGVNVYHHAFQVELRTVGSERTAEIEGDNLTIAAWIMSAQSDEWNIKDLIPTHWFDLIADPEETLEDSIWGSMVMTLPGGHRIGTGA